MKTKQDKAETKFNNWIIFVLVSLVVISIIGLIVLNQYFTLADKSFGREVGDMCLQIISVGVVGTILSLLLAKYNQNQDKLLKEQQEKKDAEALQQKNDRESQLIKEKNDRKDSLISQQRAHDQSSKELDLFRISNENKNQFVKNILRNLNETYTGIKSARRMLRAKAFKVSYEEAIKDDSAIIDTQIYDHYLEKINGYQLGLETILSEIDTDTNIFKDNSRIKATINQMQEYLHGLVQEYENYRFKVSTDSGSLMIKHLLKIKELVNHAKDDGPLKVKFIYPYKEAIAAVRQELLYETENINQTNTL